MRWEKDKKLGKYDWVGKKFKVEGMMIPTPSEYANDVWQARMRIFEYMFVWIGAYLSDIEGLLSVHMREQQKNGAGETFSNSVVQLKADGKQKKTL